MKKDASKTYDNGLSEDTSSRAIADLLKQHTDKTRSNLDQFYANLDTTIHATLNLSRNGANRAKSDEDPASGFDPDDLETFKLFSRLYNKHKNKMNVEKMFKTIAKHMIEYKVRLKVNLSSTLRQAFDEFAQHQLKLNSELDKLLHKQSSTRSRGRRVAPSYDNNDDDDDYSHPSNWRFSNYAYFICSYLTTIGVLESSILSSNFYLG